jgi:hypothetical protein
MNPLPTGLIKFQGYLGSYCVEITTIQTVPLRRLTALQSGSGRIASLVRKSRNMYNLEANPDSMFSDTRSNMFYMER